MKILVIGSGGREHALVWKIKQSPHVKKIFCAPGNGGISQQAECIDIKAEDIRGLLDFAKRENINLTVVGPEAPLSLGIVDEFARQGLKIFGPCKKAAQLEASKVFAKRLMARCHIPTADFKIFTKAARAKKYIEKRGTPCVVKADGLAAGKGVVVAGTAPMAIEALEMMMEKQVFGKAGSRVIIEKCLEGPEVSIIAFTDGKTVVPLASSQDHKRVFDKDQGPNTGGMGAYSPAPVVTDELMEEIKKKVFSPTLKGLKDKGIHYKGVLYAGLMLTKEGPQVLEFNVRFGDPETEAILPRAKFDLVEVMEAVIEERLESVKLQWDERPCVDVVIAAEGYPGNYRKEMKIEGLGEAAKLHDVSIFHAGTGLASQTASFFTTGGRVLNVAALGKDVAEAQRRAYEAVRLIHFENMHYRKDIGWRAVGGTD